MLLTAYADTEAAIEAINSVSLDYYLLKPWDPPEDQLYPVVEDLLTTWEAGAALEAGGVRIIGHRFSKESHDLRDFLARNRVPMRWLDVERDSEARELLHVTGIAADRLPVALLEDGSVLERPSILELAERLGVSSQPAQDHYDLVIVGRRTGRARRGGLRRLRGPADGDGRTRSSGGPGGTVEPDRELPRFSDGAVRFRPGAPRHRPGSALGSRAADRSRRGWPAGGWGGTVRRAQRWRRAEHQLRAGRLRRFLSPARLRRGSSEFTGAGIYYGAAVTEARSCENQHVVIIGGANSAGQAAVYFSHYAGQVTMLVRGTGLAASMSHYLVEQIAALANVDVRTQTIATAAEGEDGRLRLLRVRGPEGAESTLEIDACFVFIGAIPRTDWLEGVVTRDERGFVLAGRDVPGDAWPLSRDPYVLETSVPGVFVAGDVRARSIKRVASAVGEGSMAVSLIHQYLADA